MAWALRARAGALGRCDWALGQRRHPPRLELGYLYAPYRPEEMHWFCKPSPSRREFHLHLVPVDSQRFCDELAFRDRLRGTPEVAREYAELKKSLAERFQTDREGYTLGKSDFIARVLGRDG